MMYAETAHSINSHLGDPLRSHPENGKGVDVAGGEGARRNWNGIPLGMQYVDGI